jgi:hydroxymethylbilane synthase
MTLRLGTRRSPLALAQAGIVAGQITDILGEPVELRLLSAHGDDPTVPLGLPTGAFVSTLREALLGGEVDLLVHSLKDLPTDDLAGVILAAVPQRADPRDALCARDGLTLGTLPAGATVGTSSPRRAAALGRARADLVVVPVRGNVGTRLGMVEHGGVDAVVLAVAGLARLGREAQITELLGSSTMLPAPGQGALAVECLPGPLADRLAALDDPRTRLAVTAERAVLVSLDAGCASAAGALASWNDGVLELSADLTDDRGYRRTSVSERVSRTADAYALGLLAARRLLESP